MNLTELKTRPAAALVELGESLGIEHLARSRKQDIIFSILKAHAKLGEDIYGDGVLEILQDGFGFLRSSDSSYLAGPDDIYVSQPKPDQTFQPQNGGHSFRFDSSAERRRTLFRVAHDWPNQS